MLPAVVKLCCGIAYPHLRTMTGLQRTAVVVIGQEISSRRRHHPAWARIQLSAEWIQCYMGLVQPASNSTEARKEDATAVPLEDKDLFYVNQGQEALRRALDILSDQNGWKTEVVEDNGDVVRSKAMPGGGGGGSKKVFRLEGVLDASPDELYTALFLRVEDMHTWNPSIHRIKVLKHVGPETVVTHEVSAETAGNLIGQRDFLSVRHSCRHESCIYLGGVSTQLESFPLQKGFVRAEDGPTCIVIQPVAEHSGRSRITWLLNMDVKGWLPKSIVNQALPRAQLEFTRHLRRHLTARAALCR